MKTDSYSVTILCFSIVVAMLGFGIIIPILPFYVTTFGADGRTLGLLMASFAVMQVIFAPTWGRLSDRWGRKPVLMLGLIGNALSHLLFGLSTELWMLFAARIMAGALSSATMPTAMAYVTDRTTVNNRCRGMGMLRAAVAAGIIAGPGLGGLFASSSLSLPFYLASALSLLAIVPVFLLLPESLPKNAQSGSAFKGFRVPFRAVTGIGFGPMGFLLLLAFLLSCGLTGFEGIFALYAFKLYGYGPGRVALIIVMIGIISILAQLILSGPLSRRWGEAFIIRVSLFVCALAFVLMLTAETFSQVVLTVCFFILSSSLLRPAVSSLISKKAPADPGRAMGLNTSCMSLGRVFGPACAGLLFDMKMSYPYLGGAAVMLVGFLGSLFWLHQNKTL